MNFVKEYYEFKHKWYYKLGSLLFDLYISKEANNSVNKIKYDYLDDLIKSYIRHEYVDDKKIEHKLKSIGYESLNNLEYELLKYVICVSENYEDVNFTNLDYIYFAVILELIILIYNSSFIKVNKSIILGILKDNLFRFQFIDFKRKQSKFNLLFRYMRYISKYNNSYYFKNLRNKNIEINLTSLSKHRNHFIIEINNKFEKLTKYDEELVLSVEKNNNYKSKLFILNFELLIQEVVFLLEKDRFAIDKVIFNLDNYQYDRSAINYINNYDSIICNYIMLCSKNKKKLDIISNKYDKCVYINQEKHHNLEEYKDVNVLVKSSFWNKHKENSKKLSGLKFITINNNISYKFNREEE